jgi:hypothetical protein
LHTVNLRPPIETLTNITQSVAVRLTERNGRARLALL